MWAWLAQRVAAIALIPLVLVHITYPYKVVTQFLLVMTVAFHGLLGIRVLLIDIGVNVRREKVLLALAAMVALVFVLLMGRRLL
jgi:succinate dehydrogenase hydrophobic anchor subunit